MLPGRKNLATHQGDSFQFPFRLRSSIWNSTTGVWDPGPYMDLTSQTGKAQVRIKEGDASLLAEFTVEIGDQTNPDTLGMVTLLLTPAQTAKIPVGNARWDFQLTDVAGKVQTYLKGNFLVEGEVTVV